MKIEQILYEIKQLSYSQGFYGRLYNHIMEIMREDTKAYNEIKKELEEQNFKTTLDMVLYFET